jgi:nucleoside-diphosphate-sugar epimerase
VAERPVAVITGANGFIGTHLVEQFSSAGWEVRALVHRDPGARLPGVSYQTWSLPDPTPPDVLSGADCVIHGAFVKYDQPAASELNLAGSRRLVAECHAAGVKRTVFLSSMSARAGALSQYGRDKFSLQGEYGGPRELVVRPGLVLGKGGLFHSLQRFIARGRVVPLVGGGRQLIQTVHVDDLAIAIQAGVRLNLTGVVTVAERHPIPFKELLAETARLLEVRAFFVPVPYAAVDIAMRVAELARVRLPVSSDNLLGLRGLQPYDVSADLERLGIDVRDYRASLHSILSGDVEYAEPSL